MTRGAFKTAAITAAAASLFMATPAQAATYNYVDTASSGSTAIDGTTPCSTPLVRTIAISDSYVIGNVDIGFVISHVWRGDIRVTVRSPAGTSVVVIAESGGDSNDNFNLSLEDASAGVIDNNLNHSTTATRYQYDAAPSNPLSAFDGENVNGTWTFQYCDTYPSADNGSLLRAELIIDDTSSAPSGPATNPATGTVINSYAKVTGISGTTINVSSTAGFAAGMRGLMIQMQGATVTTSDTSSHGDVTGYGSAGRFEYVEIASVGGGFMTLQSAPTVPFNTGGSVQIVSVPEYNGTTIAGTIVPQPWNGNTGGVVALDDIGTLTLFGNINATGHGFRGGALATSTPYNSCASEQTNYTGAVQAGTGNKAEGIIANSTTYAARRGHRANGGGGGNITDAGGGGGGNIGTGGVGGRRLDLCDTPGNGMGGLGGQGLDYSTNNRAFMGGGGGSGSEVSQAATGGNRAGGGMIFLRARQISGAGGRLISQGLDAAADNNNGADGGGAGGSILVSVIDGLSGSPITDVSGGDGGDEANASYAHGTGGGGGGGAIRLFGVSCASVSPLVDGGLAGVSVLGNNVGDPNWGAAPGTAGNCLGNFSVIGVVPLGTSLSVTKINSIISDPVNGSTSPRYIPGALVEYLITITNDGPGTADSNSIIATDDVPADAKMCVADIGGAGPVIFTDGATSSALTYSYVDLGTAGDSLAFSNDDGATWSYVPTADPDGCDSAITNFRVTPTGAFAPGGSFTLRARFIVE